MSLIEVLSVIAVIAVLVSILLSVVGSVRRKSRMISCASNMRQLGVAVQLYASDNQQELPFGYWIEQDSGNFQVWDQMIKPYLAEDMTGVLRCPSDHFSGEDADFPRRSYSMVRNGQSGVAKTGYMTVNSPDVIRSMSIEDPGSTIMFTEFSSAQAAGDGSNNVIGKTACSVIDSPSQQLQKGNGQHLHDGLLNYLFVDGHVECLAPEETIGDGTMDDPLGMWTRDPAD